MKAATMDIQPSAWPDDAAVRALRQRWAFHRDQSDFDAMARCFHADAHARIAWYDGPVAGLIPLLQAGDAARRPPEHSKHWVGNAVVRIQDRRALLETDVQILMRETIDGQLFDYTGWCRFLDRVEQRDGRWAISHWSVIFDKDRLDPVLGAVPDWLRTTDLQGADAGFAFMRLRQQRKGRAVPPRTVIGGSAGERALRDQAEHWLHQGETA